MGASSVPARSTVRCRALLAAAAPLLLLGLGACTTGDATTSDVGVAPGATAQCDSPEFPPVQFGSHLIGDADPSITEHMAVLLGAPTVPNTVDPELPTAARGDLIFHSGGIDAIYMGSKDKGGRGTVRFWQSFWSDSPGGTRLTDRDGKVETIDVLSNFDDMIQTAGN